MTDVILVNANTVVGVWRNTTLGAVSNRGAYQGDWFELPSDPPACAGMTYANGALTPQAPSPPRPVTVVSMRQARIALRRAGLLTQVDAAVAAADEETRITWDYATEVRRDNVALMAIAQSLGLTDQQIDDLFVAAAPL